MISLPLGLLVAHFVGDFLLQSDWMALNKSKNSSALTFHVLVYSLCFLPFWGWKFWLLTFYSHWITDYFTSKVTTKLWFIDLAEPYMKGYGIDHYRWATIRQGRRHWFFTMIGFDQLIHAMTLGLTYYLLFGG